MLNAWKRNPGGFYTPVISTPVSCSLLTATAHIWTMHDSGIVQVSGRVDLTNTTAGTTASFRIELPVAMNNFADGDQAFGVAFGGRIPATASQGAGYVTSVAAAKTCQVNLIVCPITSGATGVAFYTFQYQSIQP